jgi:uncharacterized membrane protein (UPF0127 family)
VCGRAAHDTLVTRRFAVRNASRGRRIAEHAELAQSVWRRAVGLIGRRGWWSADGLIIEPCNGVHSFFMRLPIDVVHLASDGQVLRTIEVMRPWRIWSNFQGVAPRARAARRHPCRHWHPDR